jgi:hypothetical protein
LFAYPFFALKTENNKLNIYTQYDILWNQLLKLYDFFSQVRRTCGTTHFIRPCTILHATGFGLPPNFEDCCTKLAVALCCILINFNKTWVICCFWKAKQSTCQILNTANLGTLKIRRRKRTFRCHSYLYRFQGKNE